MASLSGKSWIHIRISGDKQNQGIRKMAARVTRAPEEIFVKYYYRELVKIVFQARTIMLNIIDNASTPTGQRRGSQGRNKTGDMRKGVWARVSKVSDGKYRAEVGWLTGRPGYAIFQEHGTRNGIVAMNALQAASDYVSEQMDKLGRGGSRYTRNVSWDWDAQSADGGGVPDWLAN